MIPQMHDDKIQGEEHMENKQMVIPLEKRAEPPPVSPRRWRNMPMSILGIALPLIVGSMVWWPWGVPDIFDAEWVFFTVLLATCLAALVGAILLRSWWALLIVPVAWITGEFLGAMLRLLVEGSRLAAQVGIYLWEAQGVIISLALAPLLICSLLGAVGSSLFKARQKRR